MKIIRLESDGNSTDSIFTNNLSVPVSVQKKGAVALKTFSIDFTQENIVIDANNNVLQVQYSNEDPYNIYLDNGIYSTSDFLTMLTSCLNRYMDSSEDNPEINFEWQAQPNPDDTKKLSFVGNLGDIKNNASDVDCDLNGIAYQNGNFTKSEQDNGSFNSYLFLKTPLCPGGFVYQTTVNSDDFNNVNFAFYLDTGLSSQDDTTLSTITSSCTCGFFCNGGNYLIKNSNGSTLINTGITPLNNDILKISNQIGNFRYDIIRNGNSIYDVNNFQIKSISPLFGAESNYCMIKIGNDVGNIQFSNIIFTPSSLVSQSESKLIKNKYLSNVNVLDDDNLEADPIKVTIYFTNDNLKKLLGFIPYSINKTGVQFAFDAETPFSYIDIDNDVVIELMQGNTDSYDQSYKQKRNIISVIPFSDVHNSTSASGIDSYSLGYTEQFPIWISLNNSSSINFGQLTIRVSSGGNLLKCQGKISCALLFRDETDYIM